MRRKKEIRKKEIKPINCKNACNNGRVKAKKQKARAQKIRKHESKECYFKNARMLLQECRQAGKGNQERNLLGCLQVRTQEVKYVKCKKESKQTSKEARFK